MKKKISLTKSQKFMVILSVLYEVIVGLVIADEKNPMHLFICLSIPCFLYWAGVWIWGFGYISKHIHFKKKKSVQKCATKEVVPQYQNYGVGIFMLAIIIIFGLCVSGYTTGVRSSIAGLIAMIICWLYARKKSASGKKETARKSSIVDKIGMMILAILVVTMIGSYFWLRDVPRRSCKIEKVDKAVQSSEIFNNGEFCKDLSEISCDNQTEICYDKKGQLLNACVFSAHDNGEIAMVATFKNGVLDGEKTEYGLDGKKISSVLYKKGSPVSFWWKQDGEKFAKLFQQQLTVKSMYNTCASSFPKNTSNNFKEMFCDSYAKCYVQKMSEKIERLFSEPTGKVTQADFEGISEEASDYCVKLIKK